MGMARGVTLVTLKGLSSVAHIHVLYMLHTLYTSEIRGSVTSVTHLVPQSDSKFDHEGDGQ
jgi:hypothetical protein